MTIQNAEKYREQIKTLLEAEKLPVIDLPETLSNFVVAVIEEAVIGVAGIEIYGDYGLLRSVAVHPNYRGQNVAGKLFDQITLMSHQKTLSALYLLTETAAEYFKRKGFTQITREQVPSEVQGSSEFSHVCPVSAIAMKKIIQ